jgi:hypothetical protein
VPRVAQVVQPVAGLGQRPLGRQPLEDGGRHPEDGAPPGGQRGVEVLPALEQQLGPPTARSVAAQEAELVHPVQAELATGQRVRRLGQAVRPDHAGDPLGGPGDVAPFQPHRLTGDRFPASLRDAPRGQHRERELRQHGQILRRHQGRPGRQDLGTGGRRLVRFRRALRHVVPRPSAPGCNIDLSRALPCRDRARCRAAPPSAGG